jgi:uncharacterized circularly permuted ATP-grasp superfamily protein
VPVRLAFDEMKGTDGLVRPAYSELADWLKDMRPETLEHRRQEAELLFRRIGITFAVYGEADSQERLIPFDVIPRILAASEWDTLRRGLEQRVRAINMFLRDIYGRREVLKAKIVPEDLVFQNPVFRPEMNGQRVPHDIYVHIAGIDIVRVDADTFYVLEDNAVVLMTPGVYNSAYYEHSFLADKLGVELVEGRDLFVQGRHGLHAHDRGAQARGRDLPPSRRRLHRSAGPSVPTARSASPGLMSAYQAGNVTLANAVGTGVADDKAIYSYMPEIVRFYTGEEPILKNVPTWRCREPDALGYVLDHLPELVVKEVDGSGGYGMLIGPHAPRRDRRLCRQAEGHPEKFIAQPTLALSTCPTRSRCGVAPRHVDLQGPFVLTGRDGVRSCPAA